MYEVLQQFAAASLVCHRDQARFRSVDGLAVRVSELSTDNLAIAGADLFNSGLVILSDHLFHSDPTNS
jgi:hypothetical protein